MMATKYVPKISRKDWAAFADQHGMDMNEFVGEMAVATLQMSIYLQDKLPPNSRKKNTPLASYGNRQLILRNRS